MKASSNIKPPYTSWSNLLTKDVKTITPGVASIKCCVKSGLNTVLFDLHVTAAILWFHWMHIANFSHNTWSGLVLSYRYHFSPAPRSQHFKLELFMYRWRATHLLPYLSSMATPLNSVKGRSLLRCSRNYVVPATSRVFGWVSFTVIGPSIWNFLPTHACYTVTPSLHFALDRHKFSNSYGYRNA